MQIDFFTTFMATGIIFFSASLTIFIFSFTQAENRSFLWASFASFLSSVSFFLAGLRNIISDFYSVIIFNFLIIIAMLAYLELFCRILSVYPRRRYLLLLLPLFQVISFYWFLYYVPSFEARVVIFNVIALIICFFVIRVLFTGSRKDQLYSHIFASIPFIIIALIALFRVSLFLIIHSVAASSFTSLPNVVINFAGMISALWATFSAIFLINNKLQYVLARSARVDSLTNTMNRAGLRESLEREIASKQRSGEDLSILFSDLDFFKKINDSYGHIAGDAMLVHIADLFKNNIRAGDFIARYGGEEFVFILPRAGLEQAQGLAERMRTIVKKTPLEYNRKKIPITCSFGVALLDKYSDNYDSLLNKADTALYSAKESGRDRVVLYEEAVI